MRKIDKGSEPDFLTEWKENFPQSTYKSMIENTATRNMAIDVRSDIRCACTQEQFYICAYCCQEITGQGHNTRNEHIVPQSVDESRGFDYNNIIASCATPRQCDNKHGCQHLPLHPLMNECETEINYNMRGKISGTTLRARTAISVLGLDNGSLTEKRKRVIRTILFKEGLEIDDISSLELEDCDLLSIIVEDLQKAQDGKLLPFSPIIINALQNFINVNIRSK